MDNTGSWSGVGQNGAFDFNDEISSMSNDQIAVGFFFNWNGQTPFASVLEIFDCTAGVCTGNGVGWKSTAIPGTTAVFSGIEVPASVPVPASAYLMGSGLLGLSALIRRKKRIKS